MEIHGHIERTCACDAQIWWVAISTWLPPTEVSGIGCVFVCSSRPFNKNQWYCCNKACENPTLSNRWKSIPSFLSRPNVRNHWVKLIWASNHSSLPFLPPVHLLVFIFPAFTNLSFPSHRSRYNPIHTTSITQCPKFLPIVVVFPSHISILFTGQSIVPEGLHRVHTVMPLWTMKTWMEAYIQFIHAAQCHNSHAITYSPTKHMLYATPHLNLDLWEQHLGHVPLFVSLLMYPIS